MIEVERWKQWTWLRHGFSERAGGHSTVYADEGPGELNLGFTREDAAEDVRANRGIAVAEVWGGVAGELVAVRQVHGTEVRRVDGPEGWAEEDGRARVEADGMVTDVAGIVLGVQAADCVPVLVVDARLRVVGAFHAGWRGSAAAMMERGVGRMREEFGSRVEDLYGAVGPAIGQCCYEVGEEVRAAFAEGFAYGGALMERREDGWWLNLEEANRRQMIAAGLAEDRVWVARLCTACARVDGRRRFFSHRAERGLTGRAMGLVGIVKRGVCDTSRSGARGR